MMPTRDPNVTFADLRLSKIWELSIEQLEPTCDSGILSSSSLRIKSMQVMIIASTINSDKIAMIIVDKRPSLQFSLLAKTASAALVKKYLARLFLRIKNSSLTNWHNNQKLAGIRLGHAGKGRLMLQRQQSKYQKSPRKKCRSIIQLRFSETKINSYGNLTPP